MRISVIIGSLASALLDLWFVVTMAGIDVALVLPVYIYKTLLFHQNCGQVIGNNVKAKLGPVYTRPFWAFLLCFSHSCTWHPCSFFLKPCFLNPVLKVKVFGDAQQRLWNYACALWTAAVGSFFCSSRWTSVTMMDRRLLVLFPLFQHVGVT